MDGNFALARARGDAGLAARVASAFDLQRLAAVALLTLLLSLGALTSPSLADFLSPTEIALAWLEHVLELAVIAALLLAAFTVAERVLPRSLPLRLGLISASILVLSFPLAVLLHAYYAQGFAHLPPALRILADSLRWGLPAVFLAWIADAHQRALRADFAAHAAELARAQLRQGESQQQLALLQAQIEPHFLFNTLGNVRRLYRTQPQAGAAAIASLMRYLHMALPQLRSRRASLRNEIALVRAYLDLFQLRMGSKVRFSIAVDDDVKDAEFPPMLLVTLVENAIKHGLEPVGGGHVEVQVRRRRNRLEATVLDDGAGFATAGGSGAGVGLVNIRSQLTARYARLGRLHLAQRAPRGASATIVIPLRRAQADRRARSAAPGSDSATTPTTVPAPSAEAPAAQQVDALAHWLHTHGGAVAIAGMLSFAAPVTYFTGALSVMGDTGTLNVARLGMWWVLHGVALWILLLIAGYGCERLTPRLGHRALAMTWLLAAVAAAALASMLTAGRAALLIEQGLVNSQAAMHLNGFVVSLVMALLYFAHLRRSRAHEQAASRLATAQRAQRLAHRRIAEARLQEMQARVDPQGLFRMLATARGLYDRDAAQGERFLDEVILFLRAALPRLRNASSSLLREVELARAFVNLHAVAGTANLGITTDIAPDARHARFPPGVLLPLLDSAVISAGAGPCRLSASCSSTGCQVVLALATAPSAESVARVGSLLAELYGTTGHLQIVELDGATQVIVKVPYELA